MIAAPGELNPLSGLPLAPGQRLVSGPLFTGPRVTVVTPDYPATWPRWISGPAGAPVDTGTVAGGTWDGNPKGAQSLPDLAVTAPRSLLLPALFLVALTLVVLT